MKKKKSDITLRELFSKKLEFAEVIPDASLKAAVMQKVARKEFLHFNPGSFNIFYLGGILIAGITAGMLMFSSPKNENPENRDMKLNGSDTVSFSLPAGQPVKALKEVQLSVSNSEAKKVGKVQPSVKSVPGVQVKAVQDKEIFQPKIISKSFSKEKIFRFDTTTMNVLQAGSTAESLLIDPLIAVGCAPFKILFHNNLSSYDSCVWTFGDGGYSAKKDPEWIFDVEGEYSVGLTVFSHDGRIISSKSTVMVHARPKAHFEITPQNAILPDDEIRFLNYSSNAIKFNWNFGDGSASDLFEPYHKYNSFSNFNIKLVVYSEFGCADSITVVNAFSGSRYFITFPNAFIPNDMGPSGGFYSTKSDEAAQVFHPNHSGVSEYQLKIFSKLGVPIFESNDVSLGWDGYNKGQLCEPGVYIWKVRGKFRNGEPFIQMGDVTLIKNH